MKIILLVVLLFFACGIAMVLLARLARIMQRVGELRGELTRKNDSLEEQLATMRKQQAQIEAQQESAATSEMRVLADQETPQQSKEI